MKLIFTLLILLSINVQACQRGDPKSHEPIPKVLLPPNFGVGFESSENNGKAIVLLDLSEKGLVEKVVLVEIEPKFLPVEPIKRALRKAIFIPKMHNDKYEKVVCFKYIWKFDVNTEPKLELIIPEI